MNFGIDDLVPKWILYPLAYIFGIILLPIGIVLVLVYGRGRSTTLWTDLLYPGTLVACVTSTLILCLVYPIFKLKNIITKNT